MHEGSASLTAAQKSFVHQVAQRLPYRDAAYAEFIAELELRWNPLSGAVEAGFDALPQDTGDLTIERDACPALNSIACAGHIRQV